MRLKLITCRPHLTRFHRDLWVKAENKRAKDVFLKQSFVAEFNLVSATNEKWSFFLNMCWIDSCSLQVRNGVVKPGYVSFFARRVLIFFFI